MRFDGRFGGDERDPGIADEQSMFDEPRESRESAAGQSFRVGDRAEPQSRMKWPPSVTKGVGAAA